MRILYIHQYFATRNGRTGTRSYEFGRHLAGQGHQVTMITSGLANAEFAAGPGGKPRAYHVDGLDVLAIGAGYNDPLYGTGMPGWRRMLEFRRFAEVAVRVGRALDRPDVVLATHTPLHAGQAGAKLGRLFAVPFVFEVRDLWPEALVNVGALANPVAVWWLRRMARKLYREASHIVALSPGIKESIEACGVPAGKLSLIPNASDLELFSPDIDGSEARRELELEGRFAAIYFGAMGLANGLEYVIEAARLLAEAGRNDIVLLLYGSGGRERELRELARTYRLSNVVFRQAVPKHEIARIVAGCDACLTIFRASKEQSWSPNKLFDALAAGKPVLINVPGWLGDLVEQNGCGRFVDPGQPKALADMLVELSRDPALCRTMGESARALAEQDFDRRRLAARLEQVLTNAVARATENRSAPVGQLA